MRDDYIVPNMGQAPAVYTQSYIDRVIRNIELTFRMAKAIGRNKARTVNFQPYKVAELPQGYPGDVAFAEDGRKSGQAAGAGTGVLVFHDGIAWRACDTGATVDD